MLWFHNKKEVQFCFACQGKTRNRTVNKHNSRVFDACIDLPYCLVFCTNPTFVWHPARLTHDIKINNHCSLIQWKKDSGWSWPRHKKDACRLWQAAKKCKDKSKAATSVSKAQTRSSESSKKTSQGRRDDHQEDRNSVRPRRVILKSVFFHYFLTHFFRPWLNEIISDVCLTFFRDKNSNRK